MFEHHEAPPVQRMIERLRAPVEMDPGIDARVMARLAADPPSRLRTWWAWLRRPQLVPVSPLAVLAGAAVLAGVAVMWRGSPAGPSTTGPSQVEFVVVARGATSVALVGDFNDWDAGRTPMRLTGQEGEESGVWSVVIPLAPGRHRYAFLVNGSRWVADPAAPRAPDDFGAPSSVVTVGG